MARLRLALPVAAVVAVALIVTFVAGLAAGQAKAPTQGDAVGVAISGEWHVSVVNADGTVDQEHAFHNDFNGASTVAAILAHTNSTGRYWMTLSDQTGSGAHPCGIDSASSCFVFEADDPNGSIPGWFNTIAVSTSSGQLVIRGEIVATRAGKFNHVRMLLSSCGGTTAPSACKPGSYGNFSARTLPAAINVVTGQQIIVTVTYSFTAAAQ